MIFLQAMMSPWVKNCKWALLAWLLEISRLLAFFPKTLEIVKESPAVPINTLHKQTDLPCFLAFSTYTLFWWTSHLCFGFLLVGLQKKSNSAKNYVIKGGYPGPLIGLCCPGLFIQIIGCPFENVYSNWKSHLECHRIKVRSDCQHAIWDCPSYGWWYSAIFSTWL